MNTTQNEKVRCLIIGSGPCRLYCGYLCFTCKSVPCPLRRHSAGRTAYDYYRSREFSRLSRRRYRYGTDGRLAEAGARFGADIRVGIATETDLSAAPYKVTIDGEKVIETETLIISTGATAKYLGLPDGAEICRNGCFRLVRLATVFSIVRKWWLL